MSAFEHALPCVEFGATATGDGRGWAAYRTDLEEGDEPAVATYCPSCAKREFGPS
jgi:hypothetical protein